MSGPWEKYQKGAEVDPRAKMRELTETPQDVASAKALEAQSRYNLPQEDDVLGILNAPLRGIARIVGAPVDIVNSLLGLTGLPVSDQPIMGSQWLLTDINNQPTVSNVEPKSSWAKVAGRALEEVGAVAPLMGGARAIQIAADAGRRFSPLTRATADVLAARPAAQLTSAAAAGIGGEVARDIYGPWGDLGGSILGALAGAGIAEVGRVARAGARGARHAAGLRNPRSVAAELLARAIRRDQTTPEVMAARMLEGQNLGVPLTPLDVAGRNVEGLGRAVQSVPGRGSAAMTEMLEGRQAAQGNRAVRQLTVSLADPTMFKQTVDALIEYRSKSNAPLWNKALDNNNFVYSDRLDVMIQDPIARAGMRKGIEIQRIEASSRGERFDPSAYGITEFNAAGEPIIEGVPNMRVLHAIKRGIDHILEQPGMRNDTGKLTEEGRAVDKFRVGLRDELKRLNPDYATALQAWAGPTAMIDAMRAGRRFALGDAEETLANFRRLTPAEQEFYRLGVARELRTAIERPAGNIDVVRRIWGSPDARNRLRGLFPSDAEFRRFARAMELEQLTTRRTRTVTGGSPTARIMAEQGDLAAQSFLTDTARGGFWNAVSNAGARALQRAQGINEDVTGILSDYLIDPNPRGLLNAARRFPPLTPVSPPSGLFLPAYERDLLLSNLARMGPTYAGETQR